MKFDPNKIWAFLGKISAIILTQIAFTQLTLLVFKNCLTVY